MLGDAGPGEKGMSSVHLLPSCLLMAGDGLEETAFWILQWEDVTPPLLISLFSRLAYFAPNPNLNYKHLLFQFPPRQSSSLSLRLGVSKLDPK